MEEELQSPWLNPDAVVVLEGNDAVGPDPSDDDDD